METWRSYRAESRKDVGGKHETQYRPCDDQIKVGALCRIADAAEKVATGFTGLIEERDRYKKWWEVECRLTKRLRARITRMEKEKN